MGEDSGSEDSSMVDTLKNGPSPRGSKMAPARSKVVINIVRPKVDQAVARMCEILLPVDDRNWGIKPTPVPENVAGMLGSQAMTVDMSTGQRTGRTADQEAQQVVKEAKDAAQKMEKEIDDVLTECGYNSEQRKVLEDGVRLGSGFLLGPFPQNNSSRSWLAQPDGSAALKIEVKVQPASMRIDPWDTFLDPACGNDHHRGAGFFHRRFATRKELRALVGLPGYDSSCIREVLKTRPTRTTTASGRVQRSASDEDSYEMWVYYGQVEPDQMELLSSGMGDPLTDVQDGVIIMIEDKVIGVMESWIPDGALPLDCWCWRKADDSPYGYGLPHELEHQQRVIIAAWRQVMDDAKFSVGGQLVIRKGGVTPQDGNYEMYPGKTWLANDDLPDVRQAMMMIEFQSHAPQLLSIAQAAMAFADQETSMPQIMGGEKGTAPETVGGMVMLYNNANVVLRLRVKLYDDSITRQHIGRHYDWQMANSPKKEIKGDMKVDARGSTALLEKDIQNQATLNLANITSNPRYQKFVDPKEELKVILRAFKIQPEDIMFSDSKIEENDANAAKNPPPQDPRIAAAQLALQGKQMDLEDRKEDRQVQAQLQTQDLAVKRESIHYNTERERAESYQKQVDTQMTRELAIAQMNQDGQLTQEEMASRERMKAIDIDSKHSLFNAEASLRVNTGAGI
jgi:hypothetical protein